VQSALSGKHRKILKKSMIIPFLVLTFFQVMTFPFDVFSIFMAVNIPVLVFWVMTPCSQVGWYG
jgi:hypothetical protein